jgi:hypothetical protein
MNAGRWLLLAYQLPKNRSNARVKIWRRLQQLGAVQTRNSVYVLPDNGQCREDFEWLRSEIVALGGEATVFTADALGGEGNDSIVAGFQRARDEDYRAFTRDLERVAPLARGKRGSTPAAREKLQRAVRTFRQRLTDVEAIDYLHADGRQSAAAALARLEQLVETRAGKPSATSAPAVSASDFQNRRWVTRPRPGVDRMASAWLIRRYIDPNATFGFVDRPAADEVAFDMFGGAFTHEGSSCTFETLVDRFAIADGAVAHLARIVHDLDMKDGRFSSADAPAIGRMIEGLQQLYAADGVLLEHGIAMFEALARSFQTSTGMRAATRGARVRKRTASRR